MAVGWEVMFGMNRLVAINHRRCPLPSSNRTSRHHKIHVNSKVITVASAG